jgi:hypothetical protein
MDILYKTDPGRNWLLVCMYGHIHPQLIHIGLPKTSLKISMYKHGPASFKPTLGSLEHTSLLNMNSKWKNTLIVLPICEFQLQDWEQVPTNRNWEIQPSLISITAGFAPTSLLEDELHFLFNCELYKPIPEKDNVMEHCTSLNRSFPFMSNLDKWKFISSSEQNKVMFLFVAAALGTRKNTFWLPFTIQQCHHSIWTIFCALLSFRLMGLLAYIAYITH